MREVVKKQKEYTKRKIVVVLLILVFSSVFIFSLIKVLTWFNENDRNAKLMNKIKDEALTIYNDEMVEDDENKVDKKYLVNFSKLKEINDETIAYIIIEGINISYPVVKTYDNSFYLTHSFDKNYNSAGSIFMDYRNNFIDDKNTIIYGHNRNDDSMFGTLEKILDDSSWQLDINNMYITLITENDTYLYEIFSVYQIADEDYYITTDFSSVDYKSFLNTIKNRSFKDFGVEVNENDKILTLSTCADNYIDRIVLHARKL